MDARAKLFGHPIHQMLIVFPLGLLATAFAFDIAYISNGNPQFATAAFWMIAAGVIGGFVAALFGFTDWLKIPSGTRAKSIGFLHGGGNVIVVALFIVSWIVRFDHRASPGALAIWLAGIGVGIALITGWLGGELVDRLGIGVHEGANPNAPSSMSGRPATDTKEPGSHIRAA